jgi:hypothetical protein
MATCAQVPAAEQLRAAVSLLSSAAADRQWGTADVVSVQAGGLRDVVAPWLLSLATREALIGGGEA